MVGSNRQKRWRRATRKRTNMLDSDEKIARAGRLAALVIAATAVLWIAVSALGAALDWSVRTRAFFDLAALGGFLFALAQVWQIWRARRRSGRGE